jgi:hypothetical protein
MVDAIGRRPVLGTVLYTEGSSLPENELSSKFCIANFEGLVLLRLLEAK